MDMDGSVAFKGLETASWTRPFVTALSGLHAEKEGRQNTGKMFQDPRVKCVGSSVFCLGLISSALSSVTKQNPAKFSYKEVGRCRGVATFKKQMALQCASLFKVFTALFWDITNDSLPCSLHGLPNGPFKNAAGDILIILA